MAKQNKKTPPFTRDPVAADRAKRNALALARDAALGDMDAIRALENLGTRTRALLDKKVNQIIDDAVKHGKKNRKPDERGQ